MESSNILPEGSVRSYKELNERWKSKGIVREMSCQQHFGLTFTILIVRKPLRVANGVQGDIMPLYCYIIYFL